MIINKDKTWPEGKGVIEIILKRTLNMTHRLRKRDILKMEILYKRMIRRTNSRIKSNRYCVSRSNRLLNIQRREKTNALIKQNLNKVKESRNFITNSKNRLWAAFRQAPRKFFKRWQIWSRNSFNNNENKRICKSKKED